ncbi:MAG: hypothetical protein QM744_02380 [Mesorhizobium sp.]
MQRCKVGGYGRGDAKHEGSDIADVLERLQGGVPLGYAGRYEKQPRAACYRRDAVFRDASCGIAATMRAHWLFAASRLSSSRHLPDRFNF